MDAPSFNTAQSFYLTAVRENGRLAGPYGTRTSAVAIAGAALCDLVRAGRVEIADAKHLTVTNGTPYGETGVDVALTYLLNNPGVSLRKALSKVAPDIARGVEHSLTHAGHIRQEHSTMMDQLAGHRVTVVDHHLAPSLRASIAQGLTGQELTSPWAWDIAALAVASRTNKTVLDDIPTHTYKETVKQWIKSHYIALAVQKICRDQDAVIVAGAPGFDGGSSG